MAITGIVTSSDTIFSKEAYSTLFFHIQEIGEHSIIIFLINTILHSHIFYPQDELGAIFASFWTPSIECTQKLAFGQFKLTLNCTFHPIPNIKIFLFQYVTHCVTQNRAPITKISGL